MDMGITVLIVDDYEAYAETLQFAFESEGFAAELAYNGAQALDALARKTVDAVILDVMMPDMDGFEVCRRVRGMPAVADLPILMLSARSQVSDRLTGFQAGADDYVPKPADPNEIIARVRALVARARRARPKASAVLAFVGAKGGVGTTTTALNVALSLQAQHKRIAYVEFNANGLSAAWLLALTPRQTLLDLLQTSPLTMPACETCTLSHASGLAYLPGNPNAVGRWQYPVGSLAELAALLRANYDVVVLDLSASALEPCSELLPHASTIIPVTACDALGAWHLRVQMEWFRGKGLEAKIAGVVIVQHNLAQARETPFEIAGQVDLRILGLVPPSPDLLYHATGRQEPLYLADREDPAALALADLGKRLTGEVIEIPVAYRL
jgi:DNA-binding response OmpR family regulator